MAEDEVKELKKKEKTKKKKEDKKLTIGGLIKKLFGGIEMTWKRVIIFAILAGIYTALMAILVPENNSFHDIAVTPEAWVLLAMIIIANCKKPLEAALKTFVFFLISQPLVYLIQVPFNAYGWQIFNYYPYWFKITLLTLPGAYIAWYTKKDNIIAGLIFSVAAAFLVWMGINYCASFTESWPNHFLSAIYCFAVIPFMAYGLFSKRAPKAIVAAISIIVLVAVLIFVGGSKPYETYYSLEEYGIEYGDSAEITYFSGTKKGEAILIDSGDHYNVRLNGHEGGNYEFTVTDKNGKEYKFKYHFENNQVVVEKAD